MKTLKIWGMSLGVILLTIGLVACSNDEFADYKTEAGVKKISSFTATISETADTRAFLGQTGEEGKKRVFWNEKDAITVFSDLEPTAQTFMTKVGSDAIQYESNTAVFGGKEIYGTEFYAYYPNEDQYFSQDKERITLIHASLPANDFGLYEDIKTPMVAVSTGENMLFKQVTGLVNVNLTGIYRLESVYLYGNNDEVLYGTGTIDLTADEPVFVVDAGQSANKKLGGSVRDLLLNTNVESIYFNLPPMTFVNGFTVEVNGYDKGGTRISYKKPTGSNVEIKRGEIYSLTRLNVDGDYIHFADQGVEGLCLRYFDTNGDGFLSYAEAYAVTEIPTIEGVDGFQYPIFAGIGRLGDKAVNILSFNELYYFRSLEAIPANMFLDQVSMAEVKLPDNVKSIGDNAFGRCQSLSTIQIPKGVTFIDKYAFQITKITEAVIPSGVTTISMGLFSACRNLEKVSIPNSVESIDLFAFQGSGITSIAIPEGVKTIGLMAVSGCRFLKDVLLPSTLTEIGYAAFNENPQMENVTCLAVNPPSLGANGLGNGTTLTIYVPDGSVDAYKTAAGWSDYADRIKSISGGEVISFADANVETLCVKYFDLDGDGKVSYREAAAVTEIPTIHNSQYDEDYSIFSGRRSVMGDNAVEITSFNELQYFTSLRSLPREMFSEQYNLREVTLPENLTSIGYFAFSYCHSLTSIEIPDGVMDLGMLGTFYDCESLATVKLPANLKTLPRTCFSQCFALTTIQLPEGLTTIDGAAFQNSGLEVINIPASVTSIVSNAFTACNHLESVYCWATVPPKMGSNVFVSSSGFVIYVPAGSVADYKEASGWSEYADRIVAAE
ncbi:MAG: leucine-rich repeat protein [Bacteroidaceae bacterium]|nr:leucine-rich repeat protein [Bacteroidaceae bacterium]